MKDILKTGSPFAGLFLLVFLLTACGGQHELKYKLEPGKTYELTQSLNQKVSQSGQEFQQWLDLTFQFELEEMQDENHVLKVSYTRAYYKMTYPFGYTEEYDSETWVDSVGKAPPLGGGVFKIFIGEPLRARIHPDGEVYAVAGADILLNDFFMDYPPSSTPMINGIKEQYGNAATQITLNNLLKLYPDKKVNVGDKWQHTFDIAKTMPIQFVQNYTLTSFEEGGKAEIETKADIIADKKETNLIGIAGVIDMKGTTSGTLTVDTKSGWILKGDFVQNMEGYINSQGQHSAITIENDLKMEGRIVE